MAHRGNKAAVPVKVVDAARPGYIQLLCYADFLHHRLCIFFLDDKNNYALELVKKYTLCMEH